MKKLIFNKYVDLICSEMGITKKKMFSKNREIKYSYARFMLYNVCSLRPMSIVQIVDYMGDNGFVVSRQNVEHGIQKINEVSDPDVTGFINRILNQ